MLSSKLSDNQLLYRLETRKVNDLLKRKILQQNSRKPLYCPPNRRKAELTRYPQQVDDPVLVYGRIHLLSGHYYYVSLLSYPESRQLFLDLQQVQNFKTISKRVPEELAKLSPSQLLSKVALKDNQEIVFSQ